MAGIITLNEMPLQEIHADVIAYGAKDTGDMGGGAAADLLQAAGEELLDALHKGLAKTSREVGEIVATEAFGLEKHGVKRIIHIVSIIMHTPQGPYCPEPEKLGPGLIKALEYARRLGAKTIAVSALATGQGRVSYEECAALMIGAAREFLSTNWDHLLDIDISVPDPDAYGAFEQALSHES